MTKKNIYTLAEGESLLSDEYEENIYCSLCQRRFETQGTQI